MTALDLTRSPHEVAPDLIGAELYVDRAQLDRLMINLLSNALKFTRTGHIEVATDVRICILAHDQRRARVVDEHRCEPDARTACGDDRGDVARDVVRAAAVCRDRQVSYMEHPWNVRSYKVLMDL